MTYYIFRGGRSKHVLIAEPTPSHSGFNNYWCFALCYLDLELPFRFCASTLAVVYWLVCTFWEETHRQRSLCRHAYVTPSKTKKKTEKIPTTCLMLRHFYESWKKKKKRANYSTFDPKRYAASEETIKKNLGF